MAKYAAGSGSLDQHEIDRVIAQFAQALANSAACSSPRNSVYPGETGLSRGRLWFGDGEVAICRQFHIACSMQ